MRALLIESLHGSMSRLQLYSGLVGLNNVDEFTFRSFLLSEIMGENGSARCQTEWHKFDLLVQAMGRNALVELKFYLCRRTIELDGTPENWKGGPGKKNEGEFRECIEKLRTCPLSGITDRFIVLVYEVDNPRKSKYSYDQSYGNLDCFGLPGAEKISIPGFKNVVCRLATVQPG